MAVLEYEAMIGRTWDLSNVFTAALLGESKYAIGFPLSFYDPSYGFILFLICCFVLIRFSLGRYSDLW
jgi:hypothetical protein